MVGLVKAGETADSNIAGPAASLVSVRVVLVFATSELRLAYGNMD